MTKNEIRTEIKKRLAENDKKLHAGEITPVQHSKAISACYEDMLAMSGYAAGGFAVVWEMAVRDMAAAANMNITSQFM